MRGRGAALASDLAKGAIAGAIATWLMDRATTWMYEQEDERAKKEENDARGGQSAYERGVAKAARAAGVALSGDERSRAATGLHWATGIAAGALYAVLRRRWPAARAGRGLPFGTGFFIAVDEVLNPLLGLTPGPQAFPWQAHARGLGGHLAFGAAAELVLEGLDRVA